MITDGCQRWSYGRCRWVRAASTFDPRAYEVAPIADDTTARRFVVEHHYAGTYPAARRRFGLYARGAYRSRGVAVYPAGWRVSPEGACCSVCAMARAEGER